MQINLVDCLPEEIIMGAFYDERRGRMTEVIVVVLEPGGGTINLAVKDENNGKVGTFNFRRTRYGNMYLPLHIAVAGTMELMPIDRPNPQEELWRVKHFMGSGRKFDMAKAMQLRKQGFERIGRLHASQSAAH